MLETVRPIAKKLGVFARDIKLSHTVFAMPFAVLSVVLAWQQNGGAIVGKLAMVLGCMVTARTAGMAANRLLDAELDAANPRTAGRAIPSGRISRGFFVVTLGLCGAGFIVATAGFLWYGNPWPLRLALPVLGFVCAYPLLKRFTRLCHYYLGMALGLAPICAWIAISGRLDWAPVIMAAAVVLWTAGFDIIYACQDYESDLQTGVVSVPARLGIGNALWVARITHAVCVVMLVVLGWYVPQFGILYFVGAGAAVLLLIVEHSLVNPGDLSKVGLAFFTVNGIISLLLGTLGIIDVLRH